MNKVSFVHCADLHLGCMPNHLEERYNDFFASFNDLIDNAIKNNCKYILISGDLFHLKVINSKTLLNVIKLLERAKENNIKVITIEGNHDRAFYVDEDSWLQFLNEKGYITLLSHKIVDGNLVINGDSIYEDDNIRVIGIGYLGAATNLYLKDIEKKISKSNKFTILMMHAAINRLCGEEMGHLHYNKLAVLEGIVDYIALGHIHTRYEYKDFIYNPGALENIRIKDAKKKDLKGYYIVSFDENQKTINHYPSKQRNIYNRTIKLENDISLEDVENIILNKTLRLEPKSVLEITIYGQVSFNPYLIDFSNIKEQIKEKYDLLYVEINNLINIVTKDEISENTIDLKIIENEAILKFISINYPWIKNTEEVIDEIQEIKTSLIDSKDYDLIIKGMIGKGGSL